MSVFLKVEKFGAAPRLFRLRGLCAALGEDEFGVFTCRAPSRLFFTLYLVDDRVLLKPAGEALRINGSLFTAGQHLVQAGDRASACDYTFTFLPASSTSETLAQAGAALDQVCALDEAAAASLPQLVYELAALRRSFTLFPGVAFTIGSGDDAVIYIDFPTVQLLHCAVVYDNNAVRVQPLGGEVELDGQPVTGSAVISAGGVIRLVPAGVELKLRAHGS